LAIRDGSDILCGAVTLEIILEIGLPEGAGATAARTAVLGRPFFPYICATLNLDNGAAQATTDTFPIVAHHLLRATFDDKTAVVVAAQREESGNCCYDSYFHDSILT
jgi:hypothetical protein